MFKLLKHSLLLYCLLLINPTSLIAQAEENTQAVEMGSHYLDLKIKAIDSYNERLQKEQQQLINRLKRKEKHLANKLKRTDSVGYARLQQQRLSYDSIGHLLNADSATIAKSQGGRKNPIIDSLKGVASFLQSKEQAIASGTGALNNPAGSLTGNASLTAGTNPFSNYTSTLNTQQAQLNYHAYINDLITQHTNNLQNIAATDGNSGIFTSIEKQVFYGKAKMNVYKQVEEDPTILEDKALEYLEGTPGFDQAMNQSALGGPGSMGSLAGQNVSPSQLQQMGYQTKSQLQSSLQQKFGGNLSGIAQQMGSQMSDFQNKAQGITGAISNAKQTLQSVKKLKNVDKPDFKINPERGKPFWKRLQKQYNWQTTRATTDGEPAMLEASAMIGYKQNPRLTYGAGIAASAGLGQSWSQIHFSFQGLGLRTFANWQWQYGIGVYTGYERMYKQAVFLGTQAADTATTNSLNQAHNTSSYTESILLGLTKNYIINSKYTGQIQVLYDLWWQQENLRSPFIIRFATTIK